MVSFASIQNAYNNMYVELRKYVWDFPTVAALADLEIAVYKTCQDLDDIKIKYHRLKSMVTDVLLIDEDLSCTFDAFYDLMNEEATFAKLYQVKEVLQV